MKIISLSKVGLFIALAMTAMAPMNLCAQTTKTEKDRKVKDAELLQKLYNDIKNSKAKPKFNGSAEGVRNAGIQGRNAQTVEEAAGAQITATELMPSADATWDYARYLMTVESFEDIPAGKRLQVQNFVRNFKKQSDAQLNQASQRFGNADAASRNALARAGLNPSKGYKLPVDEAMKNIGNAYKKKTNQELPPAQYNSIRETYKKAREEKGNVEKATEQSNRASILVNKFIDCPGCHVSAGE